MVSVVSLDKSSSQFKQLVFQLRSAKWDEVKKNKNRKQPRGFPDAEKIDLLDLNGAPLSAAAAEETPVYESVLLYYIARDVDFLLKFRYL